MIQHVILFAVGLGTGVFATIIGIGGGLVVVPVLVLFYHLDPLVAVGTSLCVVVLNALSGSAAYLRRRRVDVPLGLVLAAGTLPGTWLGIEAVQHVKAGPFRLLFAAFLGVVFIVIVSRRPAADATRAPAPLLPGGAPRRLTDREGTVFTYGVRWTPAALASLAVGVFSSFFGVGGGLIHVPILYRGFGIPVHVAAATSLFALFFTALAGAAQAAARGGVDWTYVPALGAGVVIGAQLGAGLASRLRASVVVKILAASLLAAAAELVRRSLA